MCELSIAVYMFDNTLFSFRSVYARAYCQYVFSVSLMLFSQMVRSEPTVPGRGHSKSPLGSVYIAYGIPQNALSGYMQMYGADHPTCICLYEFFAYKFPRML